MMFSKPEKQIYKSTKLHSKSNKLSTAQKHPPIRELSVRGSPIPEKLFYTSDNLLYRSTSLVQ